MNRRRMIACAGAVALALAISPSRAQEPATSDAVILITLDGARHEEIFGGLDLDILKSTLKKEQRLEERLGRTETFFACDRDLEDELIRALGTSRVTAVIDAAGDRASWQTLQHQPFHRGRAETDVLRRFMGTTSGRKLKYAGLLAAALAPDEVPAPLVAVLDEATRRSARHG